MASSPKPALLRPTTDRAANWGSRFGEVRFRLAHLETRRAGLLERGRHRGSERRRLARQIREIDAERAQLNRFTRIWGYRDREGGEWYFDAYAGDRVCRWIEEFCVFTKGKWRGKPFRLQPWQRKLVRELFGWKRPDGFRRFEEVWLEIPRKNGKSELAAAIALYLLIGDREGSADIYCIAGNEKQASITFNRAAMMVRLSPKLYQHLEPLKKRIDHIPSESTLQPLGKDNQHGLNPHGVIGDEVHEWSGREQYDAMDSADGARDQPIRVFITTATDDPQSLCGELRATAEAVRDGRLYRPELLVRIYTIEPGADWRDEGQWYRANPGLKVGAPSLQKMRQAYRKTQGRPAQEVAFKRFRLNIMTDALSAWIPREAWADAVVPLDFAALAGAKCLLGLDLSKVRDLSGLAVWFPPGNPLRPEQWVLGCRFWCPEADLDKRGEEDGANYRAWVESGFLKATVGNTIDFSTIRDDIIDLARVFDVEKVGYDPYQSHQLVQQLIDAGLDCVEVSQHMRFMGPATAELERMLYAGEMVHAGHPVLAWNMSNVRVHFDGYGNYKPHKDKSKDKIDGISAAITALALTLQSTDDDDGDFNDYIQNAVVR